MKTEAVIQYLSEYDGRPLKLMEVCGTHTASIFKNGNQVDFRSRMSGLRYADSLY